MAHKSSGPSVTKSSTYPTISGMDGQQMHDNFMNTAACKGLETGSWKDLYQAAISEADLNKLPERIAEAEAALVICARELFYGVGDDSDEGESLDDAMCILHALRSSLKRRPTTYRRMELTS